VELFNACIQMAGAFKQAGILKPPPAGRAHRGAAGAHRCQADGRDIALRQPTGGGEFVGSFREPLVLLDPIFPKIGDHACQCNGHSVMRLKSLINGARPIWRIHEDPDAAIVPAKVGFVGTTQADAASSTERWDFGASAPSALCRYPC
jgi:hypothetical protein